MRKIKTIAINLAQSLILLLPIAQLTDITYVTELLGKFGLQGLIASIVAGYIVAYFKKSPLSKS